MPHLMRFRWISATALVTGMLLATAAAPASAQPADNPLVPASGRLAGFTGGQLLGEELRQLFEIPAADNPFAGAGGSCFFAGNNNNVLIAWTRETADICTVRPGTAVFLFAYVNECSNVEEPPFFGGETEAGQRECALGGLPRQGDVTPFKASVSIDGGPLIDIFSDRYLAVSPQTTANLPEDNIFDTPDRNVPAGAMTFVAAGYVAMIRPLPPGTHTIHIEVVSPNGVLSVTEVIVEVVPGA